jgi:hypothetical protein
MKAIILGLMYLIFICAVILFFMGANPRRPHDS